MPHGINVLHFIRCSHNYCTLGNMLCGGNSKNCAILILFFVSSLKFVEPQCKLRGIPFYPLLQKDGDITLGGIFSFHSNWKNNKNSYSEAPTPLQCTRSAKLYYIVFCCIALYCIVLYCIALHCIVLYQVVLLEDYSRVYHNYNDLIFCHFLGYPVLISGHSNMLKQYCMQWRRSTTVHLCCRESH